MGKTIKSVPERWRDHVKESRTGTTYAFHRAIRKYGEAVFTVTPLASFSNDETLSKAEQLFIAEVGSLRPTGYNLTVGGDGSCGYRHTPAARRKMSLQRRGRKLTPEWKANIARAGVGRKLSSETRMKIGQANSRRVLSPESRAKIAESLRAYNKGKQ